MSVTSKIKLLAKLRDKEYRNAYVEEKVATSLPFQIRALREQPDRDWSQAELGRRAGMRQNAISRLEDAESGTPSISTLLRLARAFDVALLVKFVPFSKLLHEFADLSSEALSAQSFEQEIHELERDAVSTAYARPMTTSAILPANQMFWGGDIGHTAITSLEVEHVQLMSRGIAFSAEDATLNVAALLASDIQHIIEDAREINTFPAQVLKSEVRLATELVN